MTLRPETTGAKQSGRFPKGTSGNPAGRPQGARHRLTILAEKLMEDETEAVVQAVIKAAIDGDMTAARLVLERIAPPRKGRPVTFDLPPIETSDGILTALGAVLRAVAQGELTPDEGQGIASLLETKRKVFDTVEIERRMAALEARGDRKR